MSDDIRVGDLIKVTSKQDPEYIRQSRVERVKDGFVSLRFGHGFWLTGNDVEILDRAMPPISAELLFGAVDAHRKARGYESPTTLDLVESAVYRDAAIAIINFTREYDRTNTTTKENA